MKAKPSMALTLTPLSRPQMHLGVLFLCMPIDLLISAFNVTRDIRMMCLKLDLFSSLYNKLFIIKINNIF